MAGKTQLEGAIEQALSNHDEFREQRQKYLEELHPYQDGLSAWRVVESIENILQNNLKEKLKRKPMNLVRKWQVRKLVK